MEETILEFLRTRFRAAIGRTAIDRDTPLFSSGIVDSFGVLELIAFLEQQFGIEIDPARHDIEEFDSAARIAALVTALKART